MTEPGKWGRAIWKLAANQVAQPQGGDRRARVLVRVRVGHEDSSPGPVDLSYQLTVSDVHEENSELEVIDLYTVRTESNKSQEKGAKLFVHQVRLHGPGGEIVRVWGLFHDEVMVDAMSMEAYNHVRHRLSPLGRLTRQLRMANGVEEQNFTRGTGDLVICGESK